MCQQMTQQLNDHQIYDDDDSTTIIMNTIPILWLPDPVFINCNAHENHRDCSEYCLFDSNSLCVPMICIYCSLRRECDDVMRKSPKNAC